MAFNDSVYTTFAAPKGWRSFCKTNQAHKTHILKQIYTKSQTKQNTAKTVTKANVAVLSPSRYSGDAYTLSYVQLDI